MIGSIKSAARGSGPMMTEPKSRSTISRNAGGFYRQLDSSDALQNQEKAWDHFLELGFPTRKTETFRYVKVRSLFSHQYVPSSEAEVSLEEI